MSRVSLAELKVAGVAIRADEGAAIVREICRQFSTGAIAGIPGPEGVTLSRDGRIRADGPVRVGVAPIATAAALLEQVVTDIPGALRLVLARAAGTLDVPPFASIDEFSTALDRFATADATEAARRLSGSWAAMRPAHAVRRYGWIAAAAAVVLILIGLFALPSHAPAASHRVIADAAQPAPSADGTDRVVDAPAPASSAATGERRSGSATARKTGSRGRPREERPVRKSLFKRELFRVVIK